MSEDNGPTMYALVLSVDGVSHSMKSFSENPAVCESFIEEDGHFFQVGCVHKKLIVQRDLRHGGGSQNLAPKPTTERTSLKSADVDRLTGSKRRRAPRKPIQLAPKRKKSAPALTRPSLAPSLSRSASSSPSRKPQPQPAGSLRSSDLEDRPNSVSGSVSSAATKKLVAPAVQLSRPSSSPLPGRNLSSPLTKADKEPKKKASSSKASAAINRDLSLQDQLIHVLAIVPMTTTLVSKRLGISGKKLEGILKKVAKYEAPGKYHLRPPCFSSVNIDSWPYTPSERAKVLERISQNVNDENTGAASVSSNDGPVNVDRSSKRSSNSRTALSSSSRPPLSDRHSDAAEASGDDDEASELCRDIDNFKEIHSHEDYIECRRLFQEGYPVYQKVDMRLKKIGQKFDKLGREIDLAQTQAGRERALSTLKQSYSELKPVSSRLKVRFEKLHVGMARLKGMVNGYAESSSH